MTKRTIISKLTRMRDRMEYRTAEQILKLYVYSNDVRSLNEDLESHQRRWDKFIDSAINAIQDSDVSTFYRADRVTYSSRYQKQRSLPDGTIVYFGESGKKARKKTRRKSSVSRRHLARRDDGRCYLCLNRIPAGSEWHIDHLIPVSRGGKDTIHNTAQTHPKCNVNKWNYLPDELDNIWRERVLDKLDEIRPI